MKSVKRLALVLLSATMVLSLVGCREAEQRIEFAAYRWRHEVRPPEASGPGPWLSQLPPGYRLELDVTSTGCFHSESATIVWDTGPSPTVKVQAPSGTAVSIPATAEMVKRFDRWLQHLRTSPQGACTSEVAVELSWFRGGAVVGTSSYIDDTCGRLFELAEHPELDIGLSAPELMRMATDSHGLSFDN